MVQNNLNDKELKNIKDGFMPIVSGIAGSFLENQAKQACEYSDPITQEFKKNWSKY